MKKKREREEMEVKKEAGEERVGCEGEEQVEEEEEEKEEDAGHLHHHTNIAEEEPSTLTSNQKL